MSVTASTTTLLPGTPVRDRSLLQTCANILALSALTILIFFGLRITGLVLAVLGAVALTAHTLHTRVRRHPGPPHHR